MNILFTSSSSLGADISREKAPDSSLKPLVKALAAASGSKALSK
jgi:hypothetical protein